MESPKQLGPACTKALSAHPNKVRKPSRVDAKRCKPHSHEAMLLHFPHACLPGPGMACNKQHTHVFSEHFASKSHTVATEALARLQVHQSEVNKVNSLDYQCTLLIASSDDSVFTKSLGQRCQRIVAISCQHLPATTSAWTLAILMPNFCEGLIRTGYPRPAQCRAMRERARATAVRQGRA